MIEQAKKDLENYDKLDFSERIQLAERLQWLLEKEKRAVTRREDRYNAVVNLITCMSRKVNEA